MLAPAPSGIITLLTDFGIDDPYVGLMKGAVKRQDAKADVVDLCHAVPPQDLETAAVFVESAIGHFPPGTVHVAVVDPGVGTARRSLVVCAHQCFWLAPDNGILESLFRAPAAEVRQLDGDRLGLPDPAPTFHGRDVFAPVAGMLSRGKYSYSALGRRITDPVRLSAPSAPRVLFADHFGNLITNVRRADHADVIAIRVAGRRLELRRTYADVADGEPIALTSSFGLLEVAVRGGSAAAALGAGAGTPIELEP